MVLDGFPLRIGQRFEKLPQPPGRIKWSFLTVSLGAADGWRRPGRGVAGLAYLHRMQGGFRRSPFGCRGLAFRCRQWIFGVGLRRNRVGTQKDGEKKGQGDQP